MSVSKVPKRIVCSATKGGVGKSSTTRNLAVVAAQSGLRVATVDFDQQRTLSNWVTRRPKECVQIEHFMAAMNFQDITDVSEITGFDVVLMDSPPLVTDGDSTDVNRQQNVQKLLGISDLVLVLTGQHDEDVTSAEAWMKHLVLSNAKSLSVLNATNRRAKSFDKAKKRLIKVGPHCPMDIPRVEDIPATHEFGVGVAEMRRAKGAGEYEAVWNHIRTLLSI